MEKLLCPCVNQALLRISVAANSNFWITSGEGLPYKMSTTLVEQFMYYTKKGISGLTGNKLYYESV
jgi:hypothetical protein